MWLLTLQQLKSKKAKTRLGAIEKLATMEGESRALLPLLGALRDPEPEVRKVAARSLGRRKEPSVVSPLIEALGDRSAEVRMTAAISLKWLTPKEAIPSLIRCLRDENEAVRNYSAGALSAMGWEPDNDVDHAVFAIAAGKLEAAARYKSAAIEPLLLALRTGVYYKRLEAVDVLSRIAITDAKVISSLIAALKDEDSSVRMRTVEVLSSIGDARAVEPLILTLRDHESRVRAASVEALSKMGDARAINPLAALLKDKSAEVRKAAAEALGKMNATSVVEPLLAILRDQDGDIRETTAIALGKIGDMRAIKNLVLLLIDRHEPVRKAAEVALTKIDAFWETSHGAQNAMPQVEAATKDDDYWVKHSANALLKRLKGEKATAPDAEMSTVTDRAFFHRRDAARILSEALTDADRNLRFAAADALGRIGGHGGMSSLVASLSDSDAWVRRASARALESLRWQPTSKAQHAVYLIAARSWTRLAACGADAVEPLIGAVKDSDAEVRRRAAEILGKIKDLRAESALTACLKDPCDSIRQVAANSLRQLGKAPEKGSHRTETESFRR